MGKKRVLPTREILFELAIKSLSVESDLMSKFSKAFLNATFDAFSHFEFVAHVRFKCKTESEMHKLTKVVDMAGYTVFNERFEDGIMEFDASFESPSFIASREAIEELGTTAAETHTCTETEIALESKKMLDMHFFDQATKAAEEGKFEYSFDIANLHRNVAKNIHNTLVNDFRLSVRNDYTTEVTKLLVGWGVEGT